MRRCQAALVATLVASASSALATPCPNIMFVLDRSGSMDEDPSGNTGVHPTKWELLQQAVVKIVTMYGAQVPFGMEMFTSSAFDDQGCFADTMIDVEPAHDTSAQIIAMVKAAMPDSITNTGDAIKRARLDPAMMDPARGQYIVLITDGDPNCNTGEPQYTFDEITQAAMQNPSIHTFVIGFDGSGGVQPDNLNTMAKNGLEPVAGCNGANIPCYYSASNAQKFNDAIDMIINHVVGGEFGNMMCDDSCFANGCPQGQICVTNELNPAPHCEPDPCAGAMCNQGDFCRMGQCVHACLTPCKANEKCVDGNCELDLCYNVQCSDPEVCNPLTGQCGENPCIGKNCKAPTTCDLGTGNCVDDQCRIITCPAGTMCIAGGNCVAAGTADGGSGPVGRHASGCAVGRSGDVAGLVAVLLALVGFFVVSRRRARASR